MQRIYLDYAASTPVDPRVFEAMKPYFAEKFGNPGSLHFFGQEAIAAVDRSRETIARSVGADFREIIFTGSATEANNLALRGALRGLTRMARGSTQINIRENQRHISVHLRPRLIVSAIEHESILETARDLERDGVEVIYIPVDRSGFVDLKKLEAALNERTVLVSVMYANNEIGTVQPIAEISQIVRNFRDSHRLSVMGYKLPFFHTDAAQAFQFLDGDVQKLGVDLMTLSAHKIYGPKGVGALYARTIDNKQLTTDRRDDGQQLNVKGQMLSPMATGGGQEFALRSGTENVPFIVGFAKAVELVSNSRELESKRIAELRGYFWQELKKICPDAELNGALSSKSQIANSRLSGHSPFALGHLPNILNVYFPNHEAQFLLTKFDLAGLAASSGSACRSRAVESSYVIEALGHSRERAKHSIRFSFGRPTTKEEINEALKVIKNSLQ